MKKEKYINDILKNIHTDNKTKLRIREDLEQRIEMAEENDPYFDVVADVGHPEEVAKEFMENLDIKDTVMVNIGLTTSLNPYEYRSKATLFGLPLVHINTGGRYQTKQAKGIIAIGDIAMGVVSFGGISYGVVAIGGIGIGVVSLGGVAIGAVALGGVAVGIIALGGVAIGLSKVFGGLALLFK